MTDISGLHFAGYLADAVELRQVLTSTLDQISNDEAGAMEVVAGVIKEAASLSFHGAEPNAPSLTIALVGPYNAGKSSLIRCLTGDSTIEIRADPVSHGFEVYDWKGLRFLDTPGIEAGDSGHDALAVSGVRAADLLLFVITPNLFDEATAAALERIAIREGRASAILLVLNKANSLGGEVNQLLDGIGAVLEPLGLDEGRVVRTEARDWLDSAAQPDPDIRAELRAESGITQLEAEIDALTARQGLTARLTRPLHEIRRLSIEAAAAVAPPDAEGARLLDVLRRKDRILGASEARLRAAIRRRLSKGAEQIERCGDAAAAAAVAGVEREALERAVDMQTARVREITAEMPAAIRGEIEDEWSSLLEQLRPHAADLSGPRAGNVVASRRPQPKADGFVGQELGAIGVPAGPGRAPSGSDGMARYAKIAGNVGEFLGRHAMGPAGTEGGLLSASAAASSTIHQVIYAGGKFLGIKFRPWEAVRYAKWVGNAGRIVGVAGAALGLVMTYLEEKREREAAAELETARRGLRTHFRNYAIQVENEGSTNLNRFLADSYGAARSEVAAASGEVVAGQEGRRQHAAVFLTLAARAGDLASAIEADASVRLNTAKPGVSQLDGTIEPAVACS